MARLQQFIVHALRNGLTEADARREHKAQMDEINRRRKYNKQKGKWHDGCSNH